MKIKYNPFNVNSLVIAAIKFANDRTATTEVDTTISVKQSPKAFMEKNFPKTKVPLAVQILSTEEDPRHQPLGFAVKIQLGDLNNSIIFAWKNLFDNDLTDLNRLIEDGKRYEEAFYWAERLIKETPKPAPSKKAAPKKKAVKKTVDYTKLKSDELRKLAQKKGIKGYASMKKADIIKCL